MFRRSFALISHAHFRSVAVGVTALVLLSGCQGGSTPSETSPTTASPTSSATATSVEATAATSGTPTAAYKPADAQGPAQNVPVPVMPELAKENSKEGLEAFIRYWYAELSYSYETGEVGTFESLSQGSCASCSSLREGVIDAWDGGRWISGGIVKATAIETAFDVTHASQIATVQVLQTTTEIRNPDGTLFQDPTAETNSASRAALEYGIHGWIMTDLGLVL